MAEQHIVGAAHPYPDPNVGSIRTRRGGIWEYSPQFRPRVVHAQANIVLTGRRALDYRDAEAVTGVVHLNRQTVWHHVYNWNYRNGQCTVQLVDWATHRATIPHAGGCIQYADYYGHRYQALPLDAGELQKLLEEFSATELSELPLHSAKELEDFALSSGRALSREMRQLYSGQRIISKQARAVLAAEEDLCLDTLLPLTGPSGSANAVSVMARLEQPGMTSPPDATASPFAIDPFGNEFWAGNDGLIYFYDHETNLYQVASRNLTSILQ